MDRTKWEYLEFELERKGREVRIKTIKGTTWDK